MAFLTQLLRKTRATRCVHISIHAYIHTYIHNACEYICMYVCIYVAYLCVYSSICVWMEEGCPTMLVWVVFFLSLCMVVSIVFLST